MSTATFGAGELCRLSGVPANTLERWAREGLLSPEYTGVGNGRGYRRYRFQDAVAAVCGGCHREVGVPWDYVWEVVRQIASLTAEELTGAVKGGRVVVLPSLAARHLGGLKPAPRGSGGPEDELVEYISVNAAHRLVTEYVERRDNPNAAPNRGQQLAMEVQRRFVQLRGR